MPDWPNTEITIGDRNSLSGQYLLGEDGKRLWPRAFHHRIQLNVERILQVHTLLGQEAIGDVIIFDAEVVAERKLDGPIYRVSGYRHYHDQIGRWRRLVMKTHDGHWMTGRYDDGLTRTVAQIRRSWRQYHAVVPDGLDWMGPGVIRTAVAKDELGRDVELDDAVFSYLRVVEGRMIKLSFLRNDREVPAEALQATDGRWVAAGYHYVHDARAEYEQRIRAGETAPDDLFAWVDEEDAGAFAAS